MEARVRALKRLREAILANEAEINAALKADLGKSGFESYMCEVGLTCSEISYMLRHVRRFAAERRVPTPLAQFHARSYVKPSPYGAVLIMSPWNYPFMLTMDPLADALAAGNTVVLKPSAYSPRTSAVIEKLVADCFDPAHVAVVSGGREENQCLLREEFDYIFFTGSQAVGKEVLRQAVERLTPVTLELGGKSPCLVDRTANIPLAAKRIVFGKFLNCGQTCVAPDYVLVSQSVKEKFLSEISREIGRMYGPDPLQNSGYGKIINQKHFTRLVSLLDREKVVVGGGCDPERLRIAPTVLDGVALEDPVMQEEIFGPILPVLTVDSLDQAIAFVRARPRPLALYLFTSDRTAERRVFRELSFGGGCVNDTILHLASSRLPFGGVGNSGMGAYHGKRSFLTFSHEKGVLKTSTRLDMPLRYPPYTPQKERWSRRMLK